MMLVIGEALLMSTHNVHFYGELENIIPELSSNTSPSHLLVPFLLL